MRARPRWGLLALALALASGTALLALRLGRPLYYSDTRVGHSAFELKNSSMLQFKRPVPVMEIPGPVRGRVLHLPDGRLLYGRVVGSDSSDLVIYDPKRPGLPPEAVFQLNSEAQDFAPALALDRLYFASDRDGGAGGLDIWVSRYLNGTFGKPRPLSGNVNSALDESDPAPDPNGTELVFVRRDQRILGGKNAMLWIADLVADSRVEELWPDSPQAIAMRRGRTSRASLPLLRDPIFAADGRSLFFVRQDPGKEPVLQRSYRHGKRFMEAWRVKGFESALGMRSPMPAKDGRSLHIVKPGNPALLYRADTEELFPWWEGQLRLEQVLLAVLLFACLFVVLIGLGGRWQQLDLFTKLLLLSILLHLLIMLWMSSIDLVHEIMEDSDESGRVEVEFLSEAGSDDGATGELAQRETDLSLALSYQGVKRSLDVQDPRTAIPKSLREQREADRQTEALEARENAELVKLEDAVRQLSKRDGKDRDSELLAAQLALAKVESQRTAAVAAKREELDARPFEVRLPAGELEDAASAGGRRSLYRALREESKLERRQAADELTALADRPAPFGQRKADPDEWLVEQAPNALALSAVAALAHENSEDVQQKPRRLASALVAGTRPSAALTAVKESREPASAHRRSVLPADNVSHLLTRAPKLEDAPVAIPTAKRGASEAADLRAKLEPKSQGIVTTRQEVGQSSPRKKAREPSSPGLLAKAATSTVERAKRSSPGPSGRHGSVSPRSRVFSPRMQLGDSPTVMAKERAARVGADKGSSVLTPRRAAEDLRPRAAISPRATRKLADRAAREADIDRPGSMLARRAKRRTSTPLIATKKLLPRNTRKETAVLTLRDRDSGKAVAVNAKSETEGQAFLGMQMVMTGLRGPAVAASKRPIRGGARGVRRGLPVMKGPGSMLERGRRRLSSAGSLDHGVATVFMNRFGVKKAKALERYGGNERTERAVQAGLAYLARIQKRDGSWGSKRRTHEKYGEVFVGKTALSLLAFLGAGHTPVSKTRYAKVARNAVDFLLFSQDKHTGHFGLSSSYSHGIATYALAECYQMSKESRLRAPLVRAVAWILRNQVRSSDWRSNGGWGYYSPTLKAEDSFARASVTSWQVMALESARRAGMRVPARVLDSAASFLKNLFDRRRGYFLYNREPLRLSSTWRTLPASTPASVFSLLLLGEKLEDDRLQMGLRFTLGRKPRAYREYSQDQFVVNGAGNVYFWYYGSLACFFAGGKIWEEWNTALKRVLLPAQDEDGSFKPIGAYSAYAGESAGDRSYTTAMCILSLEIYYRYFTPLLRKR